MQKEKCQSSPHVSRVYVKKLELGIKLPLFLIFLRTIIPSRQYILIYLARSVWGFRPT